MTLFWNLKIGRGLYRVLKSNTWLLPVLAICLLQEQGKREIRKKKKQLDDTFRQVVPAVIDP